MSGAGKPNNGPTGREFGQVLGRLDGIERILCEMRTDLKERDEKLSALELRFSTFKERIFALGAIVALISWNGGAITSDYLKTVAMMRAHHEGPDAEPSKRVDVVAYHCPGGGERGSSCEMRE